jgi:hypothetical protein
MSSTKIRDNSIWIKHIDDVAISGQLAALAPDERVQLEVGGIIGTWVRMKNRPDGSPTPGIRPHGAMNEVWKRWYRDHRGEIITIRRPEDADAYLAENAKLFVEWTSAEDEEAFRDL